MMLNKIVKSTILVIALLGAHSAFAAQLVTNGGFETGDFTGWTLTGPVTTSAAASTLYGVDTVDAASGTYGAYLGSEFSKLTLAENLTVQPGTSYTLSFSLAQDSKLLTGFTNSFLVTFGGQTVFSETNAPVSAFTNYSFTVAIPTTGTTSAPLNLISENDLGYFSLDNVSVNATAAPEPGTFLWIAPAIGAFALLRRKRA